MKLSFLTSFLAVCLKKWNDCGNFEHTKTFDMKTEAALSDIVRDTLLGLRSSPKYLQSKYFYDDEGSKIFCEIMRMPEYYLTDCEKEIFSEQSAGICKAFGNGNAHFDILELGAGDGMKTRILISHLMKNGSSFKYIPIDISEQAMELLVLGMNRDFPALNINGMIGDYFDMMQELNSYDKNDKVILFLGSNIGNFSIEESTEFLQKLNHVMKPNDKVFIGFDLKKDPEVILNAYDDPHGHTRNFNLNLLHRLNRELQANFNIAHFSHQPFYDPDTGAAESYLVSLKNQDVYFGATGDTIHFNPGESIFTEVSQKYDLAIIEQLATENGFEIAENFTDARKYFMNSLWRKK